MLLSRLRSVPLTVLCLASTGVVADTLSGTVKDELGTPVQGVTVVPTGAASGVGPGAVTDTAGSWQTTVPADTYALVFSPPAGSGLVPARETGIQVSGLTSIGDRFLRFGVDVTGHVTDPAGTPVGGVDLRFVDLSIGKTIYTPDDDTDGAGGFAVFVPPSSYEIEFRPPELADLAPLELAPIEIAAAGSLGTFVLPDGVVITGTVRDDQGAAVEGAELEFIDTATGDKIFTTRDDTNAFGVYRTVVVPGTYDIRYLPPAGSGLVAEETPGIVLVGNTDLPEVVLTTGLRFSGRVVNAGGTGLGNVDLNVFDAASGQLLATPGDDTDADGYYLIPLKAGTYDVRYTPPAGPPYLPRKIEGIVVDADVVRPDVVLDLGFAVSGTTVDENLQPVADVDLDFKDAFTNKLIFVARDDSGPSGEFAVAVPGSTYRVDFTPEADPILLPLRLEDVVVDRDLDLGQVVLPGRRQLSGTVESDAGAALADVRVTVVDEASGDPVPLEDDRTDAAGSFTVQVPDGTYRVILEPPPGAPFYGLETDTIQIDGADVHLGVLVLESGFQVDGVVVDQAGSAIENVRVRLEQDSSGSGSPEFVAETDSGGRFVVLVPAGDYDVVYDPVGLPYLRQVIGPVAISANTTLARAVLPPGFTVSGRAMDDAGAGIGGIDVDLIDATTGGNVPLQGDETAGDGTFGVKAGAGTYRLRLQPDPGTGLFEIETAPFALGADVDLGPLFVPRGVMVTGQVVDGGGAPIPAVEVEFTPAEGNLHPDRIEALTDSAGAFVAVVPQGAHELRFDPDPATSFLAQALGPLEFLADALLEPVILQSGWRLSGRVVDPFLAGVAGADMDLLDFETGVSIPLGGDDTDATGHFSLLAPPGTYRVRIEPDPATRLLPWVSEPVELSADLDLGDVMLEAGVLLSGAVVDATATGIAGVDLDVVDVATGIDRVLVGDRTDAAGEFTMAVPSGDYLVEYRPPTGSAYVARRTGPFAVTADTILPDVILDTGTVVSGIVLNPAASPLADVDTRWFPAGTCDPAFTVRGATDGAGRYEVVLPPGSYDVSFLPLPESGLAEEKRFEVVVAGDETAVPTHTLSFPAPPIERCNQVDDDCDGATDESFDDLGGACTVGLGACEVSGVLVCTQDGSASACDASPGSPSTDVCDGVDNDCDGAIDEGCTTVDLILRAEGTALVWDAVSGATGYDVVRGDLDLLRGAGYTAAVVECLADGMTATSLQDVVAPPPEQGSWVLVRAATASGPGSYGSAARDAGIDAAGPACPP